MRDWDTHESTEHSRPEVTSVGPVGEPPRYGVIRAHRDLPLGFLPDGMDGTWYLLADIPVKMGDHWVIRLNASEQRDDGARAAVYEVQP